jgi:hypothetical protein
MNRLPLIAFAAQCREDATKLRVAARVADYAAARLEMIVCFGTDEDVSDALRLVETEAEPTHGSSIETRN